MNRPSFIPFGAPFGGPFGLLFGIVLDDPFSAPAESLVMGYFGFHC
ncbi:MAG: hypothetical protein KA250_17680 [Verrucomicrobiales bacterium]|nr:hypothetical protein [Verrucomicrobiales bacterium]